MWGVSYSLEDGESIVFVDSCKVNDVHAVHWGKLSYMVTLENLLGQRDHFMQGDVEAVTQSFEQQVGDVEVHHKHVAVKWCLSLQTFVLSEEGQQEISQFLGDWLEVDLLFVDHCLVDSLLNQCLALAELFKQLSYEWAGLLVANIFFTIFLTVAPQRQRQFLRSVELVIFRELHLGLLELFVCLSKLRLAGHEGQFFGPETDSLYGKF